MVLPFSGRDHGGGRARLPSGLWLLICCMLFLASAADPEPANSRGKAEVHNTPGRLVEEGKEVNS